MIRILLYMIITASVAQWSSKLEQKIEATIHKTFDVEGITYQEVILQAPFESNTSLDINDHFFLLEKDNKRLGYFFVDQAESMKNVFDYIILFTPNLEILNAKVLIYREKHGRQIGMKRWLKQFFGLKSGDDIKLGEEIDGISGATISATNMTNAVNEVLQLMSEIKLSGEI